MAVAERLLAVRGSIAAACAAVGRAAAEVELIAVSKLHPAAAVREAHAAGQRHFGENRVQELVAKARGLQDLPGLHWHLIGSLQTNKVRDLLAVPNLALVHSLDRPRLADELHKELSRLGRTLPVLLQLHATDELQKHGCPPADAPSLLVHIQTHCPTLEVRGVMAMGPLDGDPAPAFALAARVRHDLARRSGLPLPTLSLGMSGDLAAAIAADSTMVRIGTAVFGDRPLRA